MLRRRLALFCLLCVGAVLSFSSLAAAAPKHPFLETFGSANEPTFGSATQLAVDQSTGDVLVLDNGDATLSRWHADGTASNFSALGTNVIDGKGGADLTPQNGILGEYTNSKEIEVAVDNSGGATDGNIYVTDSSHGVIDIFGSNGAYLGQLTAAGSSAFGESCGVAVDPDGAVYVAEYGGQVHKFVPSGSIPLNTDNTLNFAATEPCLLAAGAGPTAGSLFVAAWGGAVTKYDATTGSAEYVVDSGSSNAVSVDPATGHVYVATGEVVKEYDAASSSSATLVSTISTSSTFTVLGVAIDETSGNVYVARAGGQHLEVFGPLIFGEPPVVSTGAATDIENTAATLNGTVDPNEAATTWQFEYGLTTAYGSVVPVSPSSAGEGSEPVPVSVGLTGLQPGTNYHFRLRATNSNGSVVGGDMQFTTTAPALVETTGSPVRTATTAQLEGRLAPRGAATSYHFEYGDQGPCDSNPCQSTPTRSAGAGEDYVLVSEQVSGLQPGVTYHYRLIATNGNLAGSAPGGDMTVTTRDTDAPPAPAPFPGPPGSDRGWEQVSLPDANGNPVGAATGISDDGERAIYQLQGGTADSAVGSLTNQLLAERTENGWRSVDSLPPRSQLAGPFFISPMASSDLSTIVLVNGGGSEGVDSFQVHWDSGFDELYKPGDNYSEYYETSGDGSRTVMELEGSVDPDHPVSANQYLYDVSSGTPQMVSLLPGGAVPTCGIEGATPFSAPDLPVNVPLRASNWVSADGSRVVFPSEGNNCNGNYQLYLRNLVAESTALVSGPPVSGPQCPAAFIKATDDAIFFWTQSRLESGDKALISCGGNESGDIYRYDIGDGSRDCLTCVAAVEPDVEAQGGTMWKQVAVAGDGSRVYFQSPNRLLPGAATPGFYRLVVATGNLRYIAPAKESAVGDSGTSGEAISQDGSVIIFRSHDAGLNPLNGSDNGGTFQYYRYDDNDRSLVCVSCPQSGEVPVAAVRPGLISSPDQAGPNLTPLDSANDFAFVSASPLVPEDGNTAGSGQDSFVGQDVYEWRDGRLFLVTDGSTQWGGPDLGSAPGVSGFTPSGRDLFFTVPKQLTFDALDGYARLYDARLGGGFPPPVEEGCGNGCPEGSTGSSSSPANVAPGTAAFAGPENPKPRFHHRKHRRRHHRHGRRHRHSHKKNDSKSNRPQITESRRTSR